MARENAGKDLKLSRLEFRIGTVTVIVIVIMELWCRIYDYDVCKLIICHERYLVVVE